MMDAVRDLVRLVSSVAPTHDVVRALGVPIEEGSHGPGVVSVAPRNAVFASVLVVPGLVEGVDYVTVDIRLRPESTLTVGELRRAFGRYEHLERTEPGMPWQLAFSVDDRNQPFPCALIAEAQGPPRGPEDDWRVVSLVARRRPRVP